MGKCTICGIEAGWFKKVHKKCLYKPADPFVGSIKSKKYHKRSCRYAKADSSTLVDIPSCYVAINEGFNPCRVCKPDK